MKKETVKILLDLKSTQTFENIVKTALGNYGIFDSYEKEAHKTKVEDVKGLEEFCRQMYIDWGKSLFENYDNLNASQKRVANVLRKNSDFYPKNMKNLSGTPFYDFIMSGYDKNFSRSETRFAKLQNGRTIISDWSEGILAESFMHVYGQNPVGNVQGRLYLNLMAKNIPEFCSVFYAKCKESNLPFYFKFSLQDLRNDPFLAYSSYEDLPKLIKIVEDIKVENPRLLEGAERTKPNLGVLSGYIGYGDEPSIENESFTTIRTSAIKEVDVALKYEMKEKFNFGKQAPSNIIEKIKEIYITFAKSSIILYKESHKDKCDEKKLEEFIGRKFDSDFPNLILKNIPMKDIKFNGGYTMTISDTDWLKLYKIHFASKDFENQTSLRASLAKMAFFETPNSFSPIEEALIDSVHFHLVKSIKESVKEVKQKKMETELKTGNKILSKINVPKNQLDETGKSIIILATANFLKNGVACIVFGDECYNFPEISYDVYNEVLGKDKVDEIMHKACDNKDICFENVALNKSTLDKLKLSLSKEQDKGFEQC